MFKGRRLFVTLIAVALLGMLTLVVSSTLSVGRINDRETEQANTAAEKYTREYLNCNSATTEIALQECLKKKAEAAKSDNYQRGNLGAQQDMSTWTYGLFWLGVIGFIPGAFGLILLVENILVAKEQMRESERVSREQSKAYLAASACKLTWEEGTHPKLLITYQNGGQTPAVRIREVISFHRDDRPPEWTAEGIPRGMIAGISTAPAERFIEAPNIRSSYEPTEPEVLIVWVFVFYEDVHGTLYRSGTAFVVPSDDVVAGTEVDLIVYHQQDVPVFQEAPKEDQARYREIVSGRKAPMIRRVKNTYKRYN